MPITASCLQQPPFREMVTCEGYGSFGFHSVDSYMHRHNDFYELILITKGIYSNIYNGKTDELTRGTILLFKPYTVHQLYTEPMQATHFVTCIENRYFEAFIQQHFPLMDLNFLPEMSVLHLGAHETDYIEYLGHRFCAARPDARVADNILFLVINDLLSRKENDLRNHSYYVDRIISILNNPVNLSIPAKTLCGYFPESVPTILKNFKEQTGCTIVEYKNKRRMNLACDMLRQSDMKITDIAYNLQYDSLSYFLRAFKREFGMTPSEYREENLMPKTDIARKTVITQKADK